MRRIRFIAIIAPLLFILSVEAFEYFFVVTKVPYFRAKWITLIFMSAGIATFSFWIFHRLHELQQSEQAARQEAEQHVRQLEALRQAGLSLTAELSIDTVLQKVVDLSCEVVGAKYGALSVLDDNAQVLRFITHGMPAEDVARMPHPPRGKGVLGTVTREQKTIRISKISEHPDSVGFPEGHPEMNSFLGVPVIYQGRSLGNLYVTEKIDDDEFSPQDEMTLERFASQAAIAIVNAQLYQQVEDLAVLQERERISMDLHDGIIQSLFALGLLLEDSIQRVEKQPQLVKEQLDQIVERLNSVIGDIRHYIFDLRQQPETILDFKEKLEAMMEEMGLNERYDVRFHVSGHLAKPLESGRLSTLLNMVREMLTNVMKHAQATKITVIMEIEQDILVIRVKDNGIGFDPTVAAGDSQHGLRNLRTRSASLGGDLQIESQIGSGTSIAVKVPITS